MNDFYLNQLKELVYDDSKQTKGRILELIGAYLTGSILWEDINMYYKNRLGLPKRDVGIDALKFCCDEIVEFQQMKNYEGYVSHMH